MKVGGACESIRVYASCLGPWLRHPWGHLILLAGWIWMTHDSQSHSWKWLRSSYDMKYINTIAQKDRPTSTASHILSPLYVITDHRQLYSKRQETCCHRYSLWRELVLSWYTLCSSAAGDFMLRDPVISRAQQCLSVVSLSNNLLHLLFFSNKSFLLWFTILVKQSSQVQTSLFLHVKFKN